MHAPTAQAPMALRPKNTNAPVVVLMLLLVFFNILVVLLLTPGFETIVPDGVAVHIVSFGIGFFGSQLAVHSIWTVFGNWHWVRRLALSTSTAVTLLLSILIVPAFVEGGRPGFWREVIIVFFCLPAFLLAAQFPFWFIRASRDWRIATPRDSFNTRQHGRLTIQGIFVATAMVAVAITCIRLGNAYGPQDSDFIVETFVMAGILSLLSWLTAFPLLCVTLRARRVALWLVVVVSMQLAALAGLLTLLHAYQQLSRYGPSIVNFFEMLISFIVWTTTILLFARRMGYRLQDPTERANQTEQNEEPDSEETPLSCPFSRNDTHE